ncbi:transposable element Tcb2 transposase [Trichonephila clavipes]|nr:transposable element Tcb2 transposase [Trichonephila clavipes]
MGAISWRGLGPLVTLHGKVKAAHYVNILGFRCIHLSRLHFPENAHFIKTTTLPIHTAKIVQEWFAEDEGEVGHLDWPPQSPDLNIIEHLWGYLESKLRARFPPPSTISALETALHEGWLHIPLQVVHDLYASIPRHIQSVIQSKGVQLPINKAFLFFHSILMYVSVSVGTKENTRDRLAFDIAKSGPYSGATVSVATFCSSCFQSKHRNLHLKDFKAVNGPIFPSSETSSFK